MPIFEQAIAFQAAALAFGVLLPSRKQKAELESRRIIAATFIIGLAAIGLSWILLLQVALNRSDLTFHLLASIVAVKFGQVARAWSLFKYE
jgi:hypothetical protein